MRPGVHWNTTICRRCAGWCAVRLPAIISFQAWYSLSFGANNSKCAGFLNPLWRERRGNRRYEMIITKKHISRRTVLKGIGTTIALPLLGAMSPAATAWAQTPAGSTAKRFAFVGFPHGAVMDRWSPKQTGSSFEMSAILEPLAPFRQD